MLYDIPKCLSLVFALILSIDFNRFFFSLNVCKTDIYTFFFSSQSELFAFFNTFRKIISLFENHEKSKISATHFVNTKTNRLNLVWSTGVLIFQAKPSTPFKKFGPKKMILSYQLLNPVKSNGTGVNSGSVASAWERVRVINRRWRSACRDAGSELRARGDRNVARARAKTHTLGANCQRSVRTRAVRKPSYFFSIYYCLFFSYILKINRFIVRRARACARAFPVAHSGL